MKKECFDLFENDRKERAEKYGYELKPLEITEEFLAMLSEKYTFHFFGYHYYDKEPPEEFYDENKNNADIDELEWRWIMENEGFEDYEFSEEQGQELYNKLKNTDTSGRLFYSDNDDFIHVIYYARDLEWTDAEWLYQENESYKRDCERIDREAAYRKNVERLAAEELAELQKQEWDPVIIREKERRSFETRRELLEYVNRPEWKDKFFLLNYSGVIAPVKFEINDENEYVGMNCIMLKYESDPQMLEWRARYDDQVDVEEDKKHLLGHWQLCITTFSPAKFLPEKTEILCMMDYMECGEWILRTEMMSKPAPKFTPVKFTDINELGRYIDTAENNREKYHCGKYDTLYYLTRFASSDLVMRFDVKNKKADIYTAFEYLEAEEMYFDEREDFDSDEEYQEYMQYERSMCRGGNYYVLCEMGNAKLELDKDQPLEILDIMNSSCALARLMEGTAVGTVRIFIARPVTYPYRKN